MCRHERPKSGSDYIQLIQENSNTGKAWAQFQLDCYFDSAILNSRDPSIQKNDTEAFQLYLLSAKQGYILAQYNLGLIYHNSGRGCEKSIKLGVYWITLAANQGSLDAQHSLAKLIFNGDISSRSRDDGILLIKYAASHGNSHEQNSLAVEMRDSDASSVLYWFKKAALQNNLEAQFNLSLWLFKSINQELCIGYERLLDRVTRVS